MSTMPSLASSVIYRFDRFELLPEVEELRKQGMLIRLAPQPFRILLMLVSRAGTIVTREEIQAELWGNATFVDFEQGINAVIRRIRTALNDQAETPRFLQTLPRRGYCFVAPVERIATKAHVVSFEPSFPTPVAVPDSPIAAVPDLPPVAREPWALGRRLVVRGRAVALLAALAMTLFARGPRHQPTGGVRAAAPMRVSVSPIVVDGSHAKLDPSAVSAEMRRRLVDLESTGRLLVAETGAPAEVRIDTLLRTAPDGVRFDVRFVDTTTRRAVWSETFRRSGEAADLPLEVALRVSKAVSARYLPPRQDPPIRSRVSPEALALYREGLGIRRQPAPQRDLDRAVELFERAVAKEPRFVEAWSAIGDIWTERTLLWLGESQRTALTLARISIDRALAIDPEYPEALNDRAMLLMRFERSYVDAEKAMRRAIAVDPGYVDAHLNLATLLSAMGRHEEALAQMRHAQRLDPAPDSNSHMLGFFYLMGRRYADAQDAYHAAALVSESPGRARLGMMWVALAVGRWDDAAAALSAVVGEPIVIPADAPDRGAVVRAALRRTLPRLLAKARNRQLDPYTLTCYYAQMGEIDEAFKALDRAIAEQSASAMFAFVDPRLDRMRSDPRFIDFLDRLGLMR